MRCFALTHSFVEHVPDSLEECTVYISILFATSVHLCFCGCGREVVTPLSPTDWQIIYDGATISLYPSIGSWNLPCQSHYWIRNNRVIWARQWSREWIETAREQDRLIKREYYEDIADARTTASTSASRKSLWARISELWSDR